MLSFPDLTEHATKLADWVELCALLAPDGRVGFGTLVSAADLALEEQEVDIADEDSRHENLVNSVQAVLAERRRVVGPADYPFSVDDDGGGMQCAADVTPAGAIYLFCLFLSHAYDRTIIPEEHAPKITYEVRDLFQVCATVAAAGFVDGVAYSFGWPRPGHENFLGALKRIYREFADGRPHDVPPPGAPDKVKDDGIDVIAWRPSPDGLPGTIYLLGQAASGNDWVKKSVVQHIESFHKFWFWTAPATKATPAMFIPFCVMPKGSNDPVETQENAVGNMQRLTHQFGTLFYRYRIPHFAAKGIKGNAEHHYIVERIGELPQVQDWVRRYSEELRAAGNP